MTVTGQEQLRNRSLKMLEAAGFLLLKALFDRQLGHFGTSRSRILDDWRLGIRSKDVLFDRGQ